MMRHVTPIPRVHVRKLLDGGLIEVAKEERIDHFIETYYRAAAEVFHFEYGEATGEPHQDARIREALQALAKVGLIFEIDDETVSKFSKLSKKIASVSSKPEIHEKIAELEDLDFVTKQFAMEIAAYVCGSDKEFEEMLSLRKEAENC